jgi:ribonuclease Z
MDLTFLGTSAGTPSKNRNVTALALRHGTPRSWYLIDCGEGTQHQLLHTRYSLHQLRAIFITHVHGDHCYGLPGLLASASMAGRTAPLALIAPPDIKEFVETSIRLTDSRLGFPLLFHPTGQSGFYWHDTAVEVTTIALSHRVPSHAFVFTERNLPRRLLTDRLRADGVEANENWGRLQRGEDVRLPDSTLLRAEDYTVVDRGPRRIIVAGDNDRPELLAPAAKNAHLLVHEATFTQVVADRVGPAPQHSSAAQVARFAEEMQMPNLILTHFSNRYQPSPVAVPSIFEIEEEARQFYRGQLYLARDLITFSLRPDFALTPVAT